MKILKKSYFKNPGQDIQWFENWVNAIENINQRKYERMQVKTSLGQTHVWGINVHDESLPSLVIFPGARTSVLFWDLDDGLKQLSKMVRLYLVETNGLPNLSDGATPDIKSTGYGEWAAKVLEQLTIEKTFIAGASFGGLICMKLCMVRPEKIRAAFLLNPGCLQPFSLSLKNLYYNLLPIIAPTPKNVTTFLEKAVFCKPHHQLSEQSEKLLTDYEIFALTRYQDNTQKPYYMADELKKIKTDIYLLVGDKDLLFPYQKSIQHANEKLSCMKETIVFPNVGHGIETYPKAIEIIGERITNYG